MAAVVSLSFLIRPLLELSLRPGPGSWGPGTPLVCPAPCTVACPEGHCSAGPGRWLVLPLLLPVVTIPTVPSGAARLPRESRGGSCRQESHLRPDGPHTRVRKRTGWGARRPQGLRPGLRGGSRGGLGGQRPAQPHPTRDWAGRGDRRARCSRPMPLFSDGERELHAEGFPPPPRSAPGLFSPRRVRTRLSSLSGLRWVSVAFREKFQ